MYTTYIITSEELERLDRYYFDSELSNIGSREEQIDWLNKQIEAIT